MMGRPPLNVRKLTVRIGRDLPERMYAVLGPKEKWADVVRASVEAEVRRREGAVIEAAINEVRRREKALIEAAINAEIKRRERAAKRKKPTK